MTSLPSWAPETLRELHLSKVEQGITRLNEGLLYRLISDSRMKKVWSSINRRITPKSEFPMSLFFILDLLLSYPEPKESPELIKRRYERIVTSAKELRVSMKGSILEREGLSKWVSDIEKSAAEISRTVDFSFSVYKGIMERFDMESPAKTLLTRSLYQVFMGQFGQPLWECITALVEVALDLPPETVTVNFARSCCENVPVVKPAPLA